MFSYLFNGVTERDIIRVIHNKVIYKGNILSDEQKHGIIEGAKTLQSLDVWKILCDEMRFAANKKIYHDSKDTTDIIAGKMVLWTVEVMEKKINSLVQFK